MPYSVKELFYTLQGEGSNAGRPAVFCRFSGCNLWTGREEDRARSVCKFCDTDFVGTDGAGGGKFSDAAGLARAIRAALPGSASKQERPLVIFTGGEPGLQIDSALVKAVQDQGFEVAVETNGTVDLPAEIDWVCVSPKAGADLVVCQGQELKLVFPQAGAEPERFQKLRFEHFFLQPMDGPRRDENTRRAVEYCLAHPPWRVSVQTHKLLGIR